MAFFLYASVLLFSSPLSADAGAFSFLEGLIGKKQIKEEKNSQNIPLLAASFGPEIFSRGGGDINIFDNKAISPDGSPLGSGEDLFQNESDQISIYVVRKGDNISQIAKMFNVSPSTVVWANNLTNGTISVGQTLVILPVSGIRYTIKENDTVKKIADKYKADIGEILVFNGISLETKLRAGDTIIIPDAEGGVIPQSLAKSSRPKSRLHDSGGPFLDGYFIRPVVGGYRSQGLHGYNAVDLAGLPQGTPIIAAAAGDVIISRQGGWNGGYGNYIVIQHNNGTQTVYGHLVSNVAGVGWHVNQGQLIGYLGNTGRSTGPHVHFEIRGAKNPWGN
ncbi:MAG: M23 family metallopeptidase [Patescibacteria group bacterium]